MRRQVCPELQNAGRVIRRLAAECHGCDSCCRFAQTRFHRFPVMAQRALGHWAGQGRSWWDESEDGAIRMADHVANDA